MTSKIKYTLLLMTIGLGCVTLFAQTPTPAMSTAEVIDSLQKVLKALNASHPANYRGSLDTAKLNTLNLLAKKQIDTNPDTALYYANTALALANNMLAAKSNNPIIYTTQKAKGNALHIVGIINYYQGNYPEALKNYFAALKIRNAIGDKQGIASSYNNIGNIYKYQGNNPEALKNHFASLKIREAISDKQGIAASYNNIGIIYRNQSNYPEALKNYFASLKIEEAIGDKQGIAYSYNNIGNVYINQGNYPEALKNHFASLKIREAIGDKQGIADSYNNIGNIYYYQGNYPEALKNHFASLKIKEAIGDKLGIASSYNNIGSIYHDKGNNPEALKNYFASLKIKEAIGDKLGVTMTCNNIGALYTTTHQPAEAEQWLQKGLTLAQEIGSLDDIKESYLGLSHADSALGNYKAAYSHYKQYIIYRDSVFNEENTKKTVQTQMQYEFDKKEASSKAEQEKKDIIAAEEKQKQKIITYSVSGGLLLMLLLAGVIFRSYRQKQRANNLLILQKNEINTQKHIIEEKQKEILDSITYAKRLQNAILPPLTEIKENIPESFVLYKPKDIVAGDFYWAEKINNYYFIAAADCTGHGVPGAMVSMVCSNALNRTVNEFGLTDTGKILDNVRELVLDTFKKSSEDVKDGMDISLCRIDIKNKEVQWSGANNPLWYFKDNELNEIKADKQPISKWHDPKPFTTHTLTLPANTNVYMFTDGFADQFGTNDTSTPLSTGKKMTKRRFKDLVTSVQNKSMAEQKEIIENYFDTWKGQAEQVDDVCVIGIRV